MKHFDLFSGYGGFTLACYRHGIKTIGFSEIDKYADAVLKYNYPQIKNYGNIEKIDWGKVPDFDLLTGGSPCQDLSVAGKRAGLEGKRSGLFFEYMRAVREKRPRYFIWENVKGALSSQNGWDFAAVVNEMAEEGYSLWWQVLNAKDFGVPQNRERIFVVGFRDGSPREVFFKPSDGGLHNDQESPQSSYLKSPLRSQGDKAMIEVTRGVSDSQRIYEADGIAKSQKALGGGQGAKTGLYVIRQRGRGKNNGGDHEICPTISKSSFENNNHVVQRQPLRFLNRNQKNISGDYAFTVDSMNTGGIKIQDRVRRLMPIECERLMGLPDNWTAKGKFQSKVCAGYYVVDISDSQRYKLCGNGVVVNVVEEILKSIIL